MRGFIVLLFVCLGLGWVGRALAQEPPGGPSGPNGPGSYWKAELTDGVFLVPHHAVTSISRSSYLVDGAVRVTEVSIGTLGSVQGRFYFAEPMEPTSPAGMGQSSLNLLKERLREAQDRVGAAELETKVLKNYPTTTHAHTVEFRLPTLTQLEALHQDLERSYLNRRSSTFRSKDPP